MISSPSALEFCRANCITALAGERILMFAEPAAFIHRFHRGLWKLMGKLPE
jgi:hypothetical protein